MGAAAQTGFQREFHLDPGILGPGSAESVAVSSATGSDIIQAITENSPFPPRPDGKIELGSIMLQAQGGNQVLFNAGQGTINFDFSASFRTGIGVFNQPSNALGSLQLDASPKLDLTIPGDATSRY